MSEQKSENSELIYKFQFDLRLKIQFLEIEFYMQQKY